MHCIILKFQVLCTDGCYTILHFLTYIRCVDLHNMNYGELSCSLNGSQSTSERSRNLLTLDIYVDEDIIFIDI